MTIGYRRVHYDYPPTQVKVGGTTPVLAGRRYRALGFEAGNSLPKAGLKCTSRIRETL